MIFTESILKGVFVIEPSRFEDERGFFARVWCQNEFRAQGLETGLIQSNIGFSKHQGTLRGLHYQVSPYEETKLVRCTRGAIFDVAVDLRLGSPSYRRWVGFNLSADNYKMVYIPTGFAHGYQTQTDDTEVTYQVSQVFSPSSERGVRWNDPAFGIEWPIPVPKAISTKDLNWPDYPR
jgi:dTDP-4-dehydrorhamnose 3,5-epimerase